ncbi:hypothetical protein QOT17_016063 [Balamuthia mandrillaris]
MHWSKPCHLIPLLLLAVRLASVRVWAQQPSVLRTTVRYQTFSFPPWESVEAAVIEVQLDQALYHNGTDLQEYQGKRDSFYGSAWSYAGAGTFEVRCTKNSDKVWDSHVTGELLGARMVPLLSTANPLSNAFAFYGPFLTLEEVNLDSIAAAIVLQSFSPTPLKGAKGTAGYYDSGFTWESFLACEPVVVFGTASLEDEMNFTTALDEVITIQTDPITQDNVLVPECVFDEFVQLTQSFRGFQSFPFTANTSNLANPYILDQLHRTIAALTLQDVYQGCLSLLDSMYEKEDFTVDAFGEVCKETQGTEAWYNDACCNGNYLWYDCCRASNHSKVQQRILSLFTERIDEECQPEAHRMIALIKDYVDDFNSGALVEITDFKSVANEWQFALQKCFDDHFKRPCQSQADCREGTFCMLISGQCTGYPEMREQLRSQCVVEALQATSVSIYQTMLSMFNVPRDTSLADFYPTYLELVKAETCTQGWTSQNYQGKSDFELDDDGYYRYVVIPGNQEGCLSQEVCNYYIDEPQATCTQTGMFCADCRFGFCTDAQVVEEDCNTVCDIPGLNATACGSNYHCSFDVLFPFTLSKAQCDTIQLCTDQALIAAFSVYPEGVCLIPNPTWDIRGIYQDPPRCEDQFAVFNGAQYQLVSNTFWRTYCTVVGMNQTTCALSDDFFWHDFAGSRAECDALTYEWCVDPKDFPRLGAPRPNGTCQECGGKVQPIMYSIPGGWVPGTLNPYGTWKERAYGAANKWEESYNWHQGAGFAVSAIYFHYASIFFQNMGEKFGSIITLLERLSCSCTADSASETASRACFEEVLPSPVVNVELHSGELESLGSDRPAIATKDAEIYVCVECLDESFTESQILADKIFPMFIVANQSDGTPNYRVVLPPENSTNTDPVGHVVTNGLQFNSSADLQLSLSLYLREDILETLDTNSTRFGLAVLDEETSQLRLISSPANLNLSFDGSKRTVHGKAYFSRGVYFGTLVDYGAEEEEDGEDRSGGDDNKTLIISLTVVSLFVVFLVVVVPAVAYYVVKQNKQRRARSRTLSMKLQNFQGKL